MNAIDEIEQIRARNNSNWMNILRLAATKAPKETKEILAKIIEDDARIAGRLQWLHDNL